MRTKIGNICMVLGAVLIVAALSLFYMNQRDARLAEKSVEEILPQLKAEIPDRSGGKAGQENGDNSEKEAESESETEFDTDLEIDLGFPDPYNISMTETMINGYAYIGYLSIPVLGLELPVMSEWDYTRLRISPCRYTGSTKTDDLVLLAHNFARHFGRLSSLKAGDLVTFTDMDGIISRYEVVALDILMPTAVEEMTTGGYDLTLFTCTYGGQSRVTVRCERI